MRPSCLFTWNRRIASFSAMWRIYFARPRHRSTPRKPPLFGLMSLSIVLCHGGGFSNHCFGKRWRSQRW